MIKEGYMVTGGNLFHIKNSFVRIVLFKNEIVVMVKDDHDFIEVYNTLSLAKVNFRPSRVAELAEGEGMFPVMLDICTGYSEKKAEELFKTLAAKISEVKKVSPFVDASRY